MRVTCTECQAKARIVSRNELSVQVSDLYCQCTNVHCSHTFVMSLAFKHTLNPPIGQVDRYIATMIKGMSPQEQRDLFNKIGL